MNSQEIQASILMKRRWQEMRSLSQPNFIPNPNNMNMMMINKYPLGGFDRDHRLISGVIPPAVTVVLEGRSICQRISLHKHDNYQSLAKALRQMFVDDVANSDGEVVDLSNAVPGHLIAYEDMENDLLLVGDLNWKDFIRVAKRIRIVPVKANSRKGRILNLLYI